MANGTVLISGGGIAGPALAFWLAAGGFRPTLIERAPHLRTGGYVIDFWGLGYGIAERMGLEEEINRVGYHVREVRFVNDRGKRVTGFGTDVFTELTAGRFVTLGRSDLSKLLFDKIKDTTEVIFDDEILGLQEHPAGVRVNFKQGGERAYDLVIGADGLHSGVRRLAFGPQQQFEKKLGYAVAAFECAGYRPRDEDVYLMYGQPGRMLGRFTLRDNRTLFLFVFAAGNDPVPATLEMQKAVLRKIYGGGGWECPSILNALDGIDDLYFDSVSQIRMNRWSQGRIALTGDAAFCVSLLAGQGSALAMISAYILAGELFRAEGRYQEAFRTYETLLRDYIDKKQRGAERFATAFAPRTQLGLFVRNLVISTFAIPGVARLAIGREIADALQLPDYRWPSPTN
ncbi:FAD-binding domain [Mesorhizobium sp. M7A.F.Ca.US.003.02.2.1]|uniref:FAD-binding domain n=4 Tax=unclassified Mesorhizobium TaxID=325217 RepID=UPI000FC9A6A3|nr:FAD-binding domain [Mesorhizobium sp. M7A.F.Ca.US.007.01.2.1]RUZ48982.1 FAD-binding domain [Mesorhizobium sp. M7A.F.Ca.US.003.02.1.1]RUZ69727.1 FAD-binding domain [Mesorhizobium sp. M7A.F.Ca.US.007.01.1.1]RUZ87555.1 FAD-binding domain [Mesorhizobium sp. M7A.F.Ca.US.003.02.2.1]RVA00707.1 FAD-binding domain [Mesorhizobium sp. M7A.F.Ca.US.001.02.1.1]RUZ19781.1 FAD-binding domain [Mesorhizobium sp. M7A.F.Ca.US.007.01.2.1]